jgi:hypothetical protein
VNDEDLGVPGNTHGSLVHRFFGVAGFWWLKDNYVESSAIAENSLDLSTGVLLTVHNYWIGGSLKDMTTRPVRNDGILWSGAAIFMTIYISTVGPVFPCVRRTTSFLLLHSHSRKEDKAGNLK